MVDWIFNKKGLAVLVLDNDCIRNDYGGVIAWIEGDGVFSLNGIHKGWFEKGIFYDAQNKAIGFLASTSGYLPSELPELSARPAMPVFAVKPSKPKFGLNSGRPIFGDWSSFDIEVYLK